jgi:hypothetical protein
VASLLKVSWWPDQRVWCFGDRTPNQWAAAGERAETMAAELWRQEVTVALSDGKFLPSDQYLEVRYESLVADPRAVVGRVLGFARLSWDKEFEQLFSTFSVSDSGQKFRNQLRTEQLAEIDRISGPLAMQLGYPANSL